MKLLKVLTFISLAIFTCATTYELEIINHDDVEPEEYVDPYDAAPEVNEEGKIKTFRNGMLMWREPCEFDYSMKNYTETYETHPDTNEDIFVWRDQYFLNQRMYRVTDDFYDREIASKKGGQTPDRPWLLFFVKDRFATKTKEPSHIQQMDFFMNLLWIAKHNVLGDYNFGWIDVWDEGENLKETFDIDTIYCLLLLKDGKYYEMPFYPELSWNSNDVVEFLDYKHLDVPGMPIRPRVDGIWLYKEYATNYLTEHHFSDIVQGAFKARNTLRDYLGIDVDFKARNPLFGKKSKAKKAQIRTVMDIFLVPLLILTSLVVVLSTMLTIQVCGALCCKKRVCKKGTEPSEGEVKSGNETDEKQK